MLPITLVLQSPPPDKKLVGQVDALVRQWSRDLGLSFVYGGTEVDESGTRVSLWTEERDPRYEIRLVLDDIARVRYVSVLAPAEERRRWLFAQLQGHFEGASIESLREAVQREGQTDPNAYLRLALGLNEVFDEPSLGLLRAGLESPEVDVRGAAAEAAAMLQWPALAGDLEAAYERETDEGVARVLEVAAQWCRIVTGRTSDTHPETSE